jgi:hypothetical protein
MKQKYQDIKFRADTLNLITQMNTMIAGYVRQGFILSVRQLYYQLVARDLIENTERSYKRIASIINDARLAGLIDWDHIEDRNRNVIVRPRWSSGAQLLEACASQFHMDHWDNQTERVMVIVEKAALEGVLSGICRKYDVPLLSARGYPSVSIMREMALENIASAIDQGQNVLVLHLGDHDPSGIDMTRDLESRFDLFLGADRRESFTLKRIALTRDQIDEKSPPPNPAKTTDSRFSTYLKQHGSESWELDALEPAYLVDLVELHLEGSIDTDAWDEKAKEIKAVQQKLHSAARNFT